MALEDNSLYLGKGWSFPTTFKPVVNEVEMVDSEEDVEQSLELLLGTRPGERVMQPRYGCNLDIMLFEPITISLITYIKDLIRKAILFYEARIDVDTINIDTGKINQGVVLIEVNYRLRSTNSRFNFVYPFYLQEANNVEKGI